MQSFTNRKHQSVLILEENVDITVLSTFFGNGFFSSAFYSEWKHLFVIDNILTETFCRFCFCS